IPVEFWQLPAPSQTLVLPQVPLAPQRVSVLPDATPAQVPGLAATLQAWQAGQLDVPQQVPSTQLPLTHSLPIAHATPLAFRVQLLVVPPWQVNGATQSLSFAQDVLQALVPQTYCMQLTGVAAAQAPAPSQCEVGVNVDPVQLAVPHETLVPACWQAPVPVQVPVLPQGALVDLAHWPAGAAAPAGRLVQVPALPVTLQAWQVPQAVEPQQTPSTQLRPVRQSPVALQVWPCRFLLPHRLVFGSQLNPEAQSASVLHAVLQLVVPLQVNGAQLVVPAVWQVPLPSQVRALFCVDIPDGQLEATHTVPAAYFAQAPEPLHTPVVPHEAAPWSLHVACGSLWPAATLVQVPAVLAEALHDLHAPLQLVLQQTPWLQKPDLHSSPLAQARPGSFSPHEPLAQTAGASQSALLLQAPLHALVPQTYGKQDVAEGFTQVPAPSQVELPVKVTEPAGQVAGAQVVPPAYFWHAPAWHLPFVPHDVAPWSLHNPAGSDVPSATFVQVPRVALSAQDWQLPVHALLQQIPCAQKPLRHSIPDEQAAPLLTLPHRVEVQWLGVRHCVSVEQALKHLLPLQT